MYDYNQYCEVELDELFSQIPLLPSLPPLANPLECAQQFGRLAPPVSDAEVKAAAVPAGTVWVLDY